MPDEPLQCIELVLVWGFSLTIMQFDRSKYVVVEEFEHLLSDFTCTWPGSPELAELVFAFNTSDSMAAARDVWQRSDQLLFVTHHVSCNSFDERAVYKYVVPALFDQHSSSSYFILGRIYSRHNA
jgi:hypothetical protein